MLLFFSFFLDINAMATEKSSKTEDNKSAIHIIGIR